MSSTAVLINLRARRGSEALAHTVRAHLPDVPLALTRTMDEARAFVADLKSRPPPDLILSGGGDGTAISLLNEWDRDSLPTLGLLPLGTGNGWARSVGAPPFRQAMRRVARHRGRPWPTRRFGLVEVEGVLSPWAGSGWDAEILGDYQRIMKSLPHEAAGWIGGFPTYMVSLFGVTVPRMSFSARTQVRLINTGSDALGVDAAGKVVHVDDAGAGALLYEGPLGVCGCGTIDELGLGFNAFPHARLRPGRMAARVYSASAVKAASKIRPLWRGDYGMANDAMFLVDACRMEFDRPVNLEIGGDVVGQRASVDFKLARQHATLLDWTRLAA
jgi:diacylglycerol kinase family enzyme